MTFKGIMKAVGKALLYFAVYLSWQLIVINWAAVAISVYLSFSMDPSELIPPDLDMNEITIEDYQKFSESVTMEIADETYDIINRYSMELTLLSGVLTLITLLVIFKIRKKSFAAEVGLTRLRPAAGIHCFVLGMTLNIFVSLVMALIPFPEGWMEEYIESSSVMLEGNLVVIWLTTVIAAPIVEEIVFRGLCYTRLKQGIPMLAAMLISAWGFGLMHGAIIWFIYAFVFGFLLSWIFEKHHSLTASILLHFGFNLMGQLSAYVTEMSDEVFWLLLAASGIASAALILHTERTSGYKIELTIPAAASDADNK